MSEGRQFRLWLTRQAFVWLIAAAAWALYLRMGEDARPKMAIIIAAVWVSPVLLPVMAWRDWRYVGANLHRLNNWGLPREGK